MQDFEKLGMFYLGKEYNSATKTLCDDLILYDSRDLTTHAMIVGMTGSGKTGLALALLEEAAIDGIPSILIDPKGDLGNLMLQFPELLPSDFRPWIEEAEAARKGMTPDAFAEKTADTWKNGLEQWGQDTARIQRLKNAVDMAIYTPGNNSGRPIQILRSFAAPQSAIVQDDSAYRDRIMFAVSGLLGLIGIESDPVQSREHVLLSNILDKAWQTGKDLDIVGIINETIKPSFDKIGVFDLESFYPAKERFKLAMSLNNLLASPGFSAWLTGEPLDVQRLLFTPEGKPRVSVLYIAHLSDAERMFFVTVLLNEVLSWMRSQPGTGSLRALLYMDEIFGYFPPIATPPSKLPMLTLLKQARAFGLGIALSSQNPVDLDYKGLSNCGTWFIGRLQTERDKIRVLEGLEGVSSGSGGFDRGAMEKTISGLGNRVFLMRNVHEHDSVVFQTRWVMSYLRGPLTMPQVKKLISFPQTPGLSDTLSASIPTTRTVGTAPLSHIATSETRPAMLPDTPEYFLRPHDGSGEVIYRPKAIATAKLHFVDAGAKLDQWVTKTLIAPFSDDGCEALWDEADSYGDIKKDIDMQPVLTSRFAVSPTGAANVKNLAEWRKTALNHFYQYETLSLMHYPVLKLVSSIEEQEGDFRARITQSLREKRDHDVYKIKTRYAPKLQRLSDQIQRHQERVAKEKEQADQQKLSTVLSVGATLLGAMVGRGAGVGTISRAANAAKSAGRIGKENADVQRAVESVEVLQERLKLLEAQFEQDLDAVQSDIDPMQVELLTMTIRPRKSDISIGIVGICWFPWRTMENGLEERAF